MEMFAEMGKYVNHIQMIAALTGGPAKAQDNLNKNRLYDT